MTTDTQFLYPELMDVVRLFGEDADCAHTFRREGDRFVNEVRVGGHTYAFAEEHPCVNEIEFKRYAKRYAKLALYEALRAETGRFMPWGALTGIRPTKLAYAELAEGRPFEPLFEKFGVCPENIALVGRILRAQQGLYGFEPGAADLYAGIPFCPTRCNYCSFITADIRRTGQYVGDYLTALEREVAACAGLFSSLRSAYVGGGTPFVLSAAELRRVLEALAPLVPAGCEYTVEAGRPDVFTDEKLALLEAFGVTRVCVNPQSFCDKTLARIGREHTAADIARAFAMARRYPFDVNCDLIAGLTGESVEEFCQSVDRAVELSPENITVHTLCLKKGARLKEEESRLHVEGIREMIAYSREKLTAAGYEPYYLYRQKYMAGNAENTGWAKPGKACAYNVGVMEEIRDNLACGANAVSKKLFARGARIERAGAPKDIPTYIASVGTVIARKRELFCGG